MVNVGRVAAKITIKTRVFLVLLFLDVGILKFDGDGAAFMVVSSDREDLVHLH